MQTRRSFLAHGLGVPAVLAAGPVRAAAPLELAYSSWVPPTHVLMKDFMVPWGQQVEKATGGRVKIRFLPKPVTNPQGHRDAVRNGVADLAFISLSYYPGRFELMKFAMLPFSGNSALSTSVAAWRMFDKYLHRMDDEGFLVLGIYGHGPGGVYTVKKKIEKIDDFRDLKIRIGGGMQADIAKVLNVNAIVKPAPESYELLSTNRVMMATREEPRDYVLATGVAASIRDFASAAFAAAGMSLEWRGAGAEEVAVDAATGQVRVRVDPAFFRPVDAPLLVGDAARARAELGFRPSLDLAGLARRMVEADLARERAAGGA